MMNGKKCIFSEYTQRIMVEKLQVPKIELIGVMIHFHGIKAQI